MAERGEPLTDREKEVLELVATGITNREVAQELFISINTVKVHLRNIYTKLGADSRTEATMVAVREGWVGVPETDQPSSEERASEPEVAPAPPLPWPKRVALLGALFLVVSILVVTWPRAEAQAGAGVELFPDGPAAATVNGSDQAESAWHERAQMPTRRAHLGLAAAAERLIAIGGQTPDGVTGVVEAYDPEEDIWTPRAEKPIPVAHIGAATIDGLVYVPGGRDADGAPIRIVEVYDPQADTWREASSLPEPLCAYALVAHDDELHLFGGWDGERYVSTAYAYNPESDEWRVLPDMDIARGFAGAASLDDQIYVVGGYDGQRELTDCAAFDPLTEAWSQCAPLTVGRGGLGVAAIGGRLYAIGGGGSSTYLGFNERYSLDQDDWQIVDTPLVGEWRNPGVAVFGATIYAIGGWSRDYLSLNQALDPFPFQIFIPVSQQ